MTLKRECLDDLSYTTDGDDKAERVLADWEKKLSAKCAESSPLFFRLCSRIPPPPPPQLSLRPALSVPFTASPSAPVFRLVSMFFFKKERN